MVDVWKFDNDPVDYLIYVYDDIIDVPIMGYAVSIKRDKKGKYLGMAGKKYITSMISCMSQGFSYDMRKIPQFNSLKPVLIMNNPMGIKLFDWARQTGCLLRIRCFRNRRTFPLQRPFTYKKTTSRITY